MADREPDRWIYFLDVNGDACLLYTLLWYEQIIMYRNNVKYA